MASGSITRQVMVGLGINVSSFTRGLANANNASNDFMKKTQLAFLGASTALGIVITKAAQVGAAFDKEMSYVAAVTAGTTQEIENLRDTARQVARETEFTAVQTAEGLKLLAMAGFDVQESMTALPSVANLATMGLMTLGEAADFSTNILRQFELDISELEKVGDIIMTTANSANTSVRQVATAFTYAGSSANRFNMTVEETSAFIGLLANRGIKASMAGTTLRTAMMRLASPTAAASEIMQKYNISMEDSSGQTRDFTDVLMDLVSSGMPAADAMELLGVRGANLQSLFSLSREEINKFIATLELSNGALAESASVVRKNYTNQYEQMISKMRDAQISFYDTFKETGIAVFQTIGEKLNIFSDDIKTNEDTFREWAKTGVDSAINIYSAFKLLGKGIQTVAAIGTVGFAWLAEKLKITSNDIISKEAEMTKLAIKGYKDENEALNENIENYKEKQKKWSEGNDLWNKYQGRIEDANKEIEKNTEWIDKLDLKLQDLNVDTKGQAESEKMLKDAIGFLSETMKDTTDVWDENIKLREEFHAKINQVIKDHKDETDAFNEKKKAIEEAAKAMNIYSLSQEQYVASTQWGTGGPKFSTDDYAKSMDEVSAMRKQFEQQNLSSVAQNLKAIEDAYLESQNEIFALQIEASETNALLEQNDLERTRQIAELKLDIEKNLQSSILSITGTAYEQEKAQNDAKIEELLSYYDAQTEMLVSFLTTQDEIKAFYGERDIEREQLSYEAQKKFDQMKVASARKGMEDDLKTIAEGAKKGSDLQKAAFASYKAMAILNTTIGTIQSAQNVFTAVSNAAYLGPAAYPMAVAAAALAYGAGIARVAMISQQTLPSYDTGGISEAPGYYYAGIREAHIPLNDNRKIPVEIKNGQSEKQPKENKQNINIVLENPVFQDTETQQRVMANIASMVVEMKASDAIINSFQNDGRIRNLIRYGE